MGLTRLSGVDASNLVFERGDNVSGIAVVGFLGPASWVDRDGRPDVARLRELLEPRVRRIAALNRRVLETRWYEGLPVWLAVPADLELHVRCEADVDGTAGLERLCGRLIARALPRDRPLWELVVARVAPDRCAVVLHLHHAVADGLAAARLADELFGAEEPVGPESLRRFDAVPDRRALVADSWRAMAKHLAVSLRRRGHLRRGGAALATGISGSRAMLGRSLPATALLGPLGPDRAVGLLEVDLARFRDGARACGGTVNDALLAAVAGAAHALLTELGEPLDELTVSVPVALRAPGAVDQGNLTGVMLVALPLWETDLPRRIRWIAARTAAEKARARASGTFPLTRYRWSAQLMRRMAGSQRLVAMFISDVPGPAGALAVAGATLAPAWPLVALGGNVRVGITGLSYAGRFAVTVVYASGPLPQGALKVDALRAELEAVVRLG